MPLLNEYLDQYQPGRQAILGALGRPPAENRHADLLLKLNPDAIQPPREVNPIEEVQKFFGPPPEVKAAMQRLDALRATGREGQRAAMFSPDAALVRKWQAEFAFMSTFGMGGAGQVMKGVFAKGAKGRPRAVAPSQEVDMARQALVPSQEVNMLSVGGAPRGLLDPSELGLAQPASPAQFSPRGQYDPIQQAEVVEELGVPWITSSGARGAVSAPPHITSHQARTGQVGEWTNLAREGAEGRFFYDESGRMLERGSATPEHARRTAGGLAITSPQTGVAGNQGFANQALNQSLAGQSIEAGRYPIKMGERLEEMLYGKGEMIGGMKTFGFMGDLLKDIDPKLIQDIAVDVWMMRAGRYPAFMKPTSEITATVTTGQYNYVRGMAGDVAKRLNAQNPAVPWSRDQVQAAIWHAVRKRAGQAGPEGSAVDFMEGLMEGRVREVWETTPGVTTGSDIAERSLKDRIDYHTDMSSVFIDPEDGMDVIMRDFGLLQAEPFPGAGSFGGQSNPATVSSFGAGGKIGRVDDATRTMADAAALTRNLLTRQDAMAWLKPYAAPNLSANKTTAIILDVGRPLSHQETNAINAAIKKQFGNNFFAPIASPEGAVFSNPGKSISGLDNAEFGSKIAKSLDEAKVGGDVYGGVSDGNYLENNWNTFPGGERYREAIAELPSHLRSRAYNLLARLGPKVAKIEDQWAARGWRVPAERTRFWQDRTFQELQVKQRLPKSLPGPLAPWKELGPSQGRLGLLGGAMAQAP